MWFPIRERLRVGIVPIAVFCLRSVCAGLPAEADDIIRAQNLKLEISDSFIERPGEVASTNLLSITAVCTTMYGLLAVCWMMLGALPENYPHRATMRIALLCLSWSAASVGMSLLNKGLISDLEAPALVAICQMIITAVATLVSCYKQLRSAPSGQLRMWMVVPIFFAGVLCTSFYTLKYISLSVLTLVRNLAPLFILPIEKLVMPPDKQPRLTLSVIAAILVMLCGAAVYCEGVKGISVLGVCFGVLNLIVAMVVRIIEKRLLTLECKDLTSGVCTCITNFAGLLPCLVLAAASNEFQTLKTNTAMWTNPVVVVVLAMSGLVGLGIGYFGYETQRVITATSMVVLQNVAKVATVTFGVTVFGDPMTVSALIGISLSIFGSILYGMAQLSESSAEQAERQGLLKEQQVIKHTDKPRRAEA